MKLATRRLVLRDYGASDFEAVHAFASDPRTTAFVDWGPNAEQDTLDFLEFCRRKASEVPRTNHTLAITRDGEVIGSAGLTMNARARRDRAREAEIGYTIRPDQWGNGYATEAAAALIDFGFSQLHLSRITATCRPENVASAGVLQKVGMGQVGLLKNDRLISGRWMDSLVFAIDAVNRSPDPVSADTWSSQAINLVRAF
ncbi:GNAT family N-acetyltransferase [Arthrobacter wenxiniae]|jgi:RimJ/RimL family protein N-acetyltransferase|uniref:GNAT family N-acetyltransferase n=1 Tax=Arthrobacter wenxiniae TaxID=2713570 RepID=A0A7Y7LWK2_9MICC|nr:GNAT family N-acetyltransferase [Arthrobacter wenxiniae]NVM93370.1 GNAT family N-acetyltransferase [Arthrobacter wenxiniae]